ncbi:MAG: hypothetical protein LBI87_08080 [Candidatus Accumulibacter sp.]|nr:hypothetical protein [Accumulibacter sp.]
MRAERARHRHPAGDFPGGLQRPARGVDEASRESGGGHFADFHENARGRMDAEFFAEPRRHAVGEAGHGRFEGFPAFGDAGNKSADEIGAELGELRWQIDAEP